MTHMKTSCHLRGVRGLVLVPVQVNLHADGKTPNSFRARPLLRRSRYLGEGLCSPYTSTDWACAPLEVYDSSGPGAARLQAVCQRQSSNLVAIKRWIRSRNGLRGTSPGEVFLRSLLMT